MTPVPSGAARTSTAARVRVGWRLAVLAACTVAAGVLVVVPALLLQPFAPQEPADVEAAFRMRRVSPVATLALLAAGAAVALPWAARAGSLVRRCAVLATLVPLAALAWLSRQNHFEWMFPGLPAPAFVEAHRAEHVDPCDMVLAVAVEDEARAYPVRLLAHHHVVNDVVAGRPITATY